MTSIGSWHYGFPVPDAARSVRSGGFTGTMAEALKRVGVEVKLVVVEGNGHGEPGFSSLENRRLIEDLFAKRLGEAATTAMNDRKRSFGVHPGRSVTNTLPNRFGTIDAMAEATESCGSH